MLNPLNAYRFLCYTFSMDQPFVSIIVPAYNAEATMDGCIKSLLAQSYPRDRYEVLVVDNGSSDRTPDIIKSHPVRFFRETRIKSSYAARNAALPYAEGEILAFTDSDCVAEPDWLTEGVKSFTDEKVGCAAGGIKSPPASNYIEVYLGRKDFLSQRESYKFFDFLPFAQTANAFYRKMVLDRIGNFKSSWKSGGDADLCWRMQLETDYKLDFNDNAVVLHNHRATLDELYRQFRTHGEGQAYLYKAYSAHLKRYTFKQPIYILLRLFGSVLSCIGATDPALRDMHPLAREKRLNNILFAARTLGRIRGGIKNGIFFV